MKNKILFLWRTGSAAAAGTPEITGHFFKEPQQDADSSWLVPALPIIDFYK